MLTREAADLPFWTLKAYSTCASIALDRAFSGRLAANLEGWIASAWEDEIEGYGTHLHRPILAPGMWRNTAGDPPPC